MKMLTRAKVTLLFGLLVSGLSAANYYPGEIEPERLRVVERISASILADLKHNFAVGGHSPELAESLARASIEAFSWCAVEAAVHQANEHNLSIGFVLDTVFGIAQDPEDHDKTKDIDWTTLERQISSCNKTLREPLEVQD